jgi:acyl carrier protein phosphodiesterase
MNFLAHAHLSGKNEDILFGNFIADAVKGKAFNGFTKDVRNGIILHRKIDSFTDNHVVFRNTLERVRKDFGKYSGVAVDIYYDHFLAKNWNQYHDLGLKAFAAYVYSIVKRNYAILPSKTKRLLPFLITQNWLYGYSSLNSLELVFYGMDRRTGFKSGMSRAVKVLQQNYSNINDDFDEFYPQIIGYTNDLLSGLNKDKDQ